MTKTIANLAPAGFSGSAISKATSFSLKSMKTTSETISISMDSERGLPISSKHHSELYFAKAILFS